MTWCVWRLTPNSAAVAAQSTVTNSAAVAAQSTVSKSAASMLHSAHAALRISSADTMLLLPSAVRGTHAGASRRLRRQRRLRLRGSASCRAAFDRGSTTCWSRSVSTGPGLAPASSSFGLLKTNLASHDHRQLYYISRHIVSSGATRFKGRQTLLSTANFICCRPGGGPLIRVTTRGILPQNFLITLVPRFF